MISQEPIQENRIIIPQEAELEQRIQNYLKSEFLLNNFFKTLNYCGPHCIQKYPNLKNFVGCCTSDFYMAKHSKSRVLYEADPALELLEKKVTEKCGFQIKRESECRYHCDTGCRLKDHKSPICVSYFCYNIHQHLRTKFNIELHNDEILTHLLLVMGGKTTPEQNQSFNDQIRFYTQVVESLK